MTETDTPRPVARLGMEGDGVVETAAGPVYVAGALPGEMARLRDGSWHLVEPSSADRRGEPLCSHFGRCGGCSLHHLSDRLYREWKASLLRDALATQGIEMRQHAMISVPRQSRRRAVLAVRREGDGVVAGFHRPRSAVIEPLRDCAVLTPAIMAGLAGIRDIARVLLVRGSDTRVTVTDTRQGLDLAFESTRPGLGAADRTSLAAIMAGHPIARISAGTETLLMRAPPHTVIAGIDVALPPGAFLQASLAAEVAMQAIVLGAAGKAKRIADLFSGLGTFALALAAKGRVLAVDSDKALLAALAAAGGRPGMKPLETRLRNLFEDPLSPRELEPFDLVVFDPPRAGAAAQSRALARSGVRTVVAVSCNPATLARDLRLLIDGGYRLAGLTPVDQFLFTPHLEAVAVLQR